MATRRNSVKNHTEYIEQRLVNLITPFESSKLIKLFYANSKIKQIAIFVNLLKASKLNVHIFNCFYQCSRKH